MEGIEGEIVYQFRKVNKQMSSPVQYEIHFYNVLKNIKSLQR